MTYLVASDEVLHTDPVPGGADDVPLSITAVCVDEHCVGQCWRPVNTELLARLIAIVAMGQLAYAARIIMGLSPAQSVLIHHVLREEAKRHLRIIAEQPERAEALRAHRDDGMFQIISWIAAQQSTSGAALLRDPHTKPKTQGLDGLMLERTAEGEISRDTIFEDKCFIHPRAVTRKVASSLVGIGSRVRFRLQQRQRSLDCTVMPLRA